MTPGPLSTADSSIHEVKLGRTRRALLDLDLDVDTGRQIEALQ